MIRGPKGWMRAGAKARLAARRTHRDRLRAAVNACGLFEDLERRSMLSVAPTAVINGPYVLSEGSAIQLSGAGSSDADGTIFSYRWDLDYDGKTFNNDAVIPASVSSTGSFVYFAADDSPPKTIALRVIDNTGDVSAIVTTTLTVNNVAPTISVSGADSTAEGQSYTINFSHSTDPGTDTITGWTVDWGDGSDPEDVAANATSASHVFDGNGSYTVTVTATDEDGDYSNTKSVNVSNVAPTLTVTGDDSVAEAGSYTVNFSATDPGDDTITGWSIDWGDGSAPTSAAANATSANHTYADNGSYTITVTATDEDGSYNATKNVSVTNVAPVLSNLAINASVTEGSTATLTGDIADASSADSFSLIVNWGDGTSDTYSFPAGTTTFSKDHTYADDNPAGTASDMYTVSVTLSDDDLDSDGDSSSITVSNDTPVSTITGDATADEGVSYNLNLSAADAGTADTYTWLIDWGDGATSNVTDGSTSTTHVFPDNGSYTITATLTDDDGGSSMDTLGVTVDDVAPGIELTGNNTSAEGQSCSLSFSIEDVAADPATSWDVNWGDGTTVNLAGGASSSSHTYIDDGIYTITVTVDTKDGSSNTTKIIAVTNVAPTITLTGDDTLDEASAYTLNFSATDPGDDTITDWVVDWGDGSAPETFAPNATSAMHPYTDNGAFIIEFSAVDEDDTHTTTRNITVNNLAPTITATGDNNVDEGATYTLDFSAAGDPGPDTISGWSINWGDGTAPEPFPANAVSANHTFADNGSYTITVTATDEDGEYNATKNLTVDNVVPTITVTGNNGVNEGTSYTVNFSASGDSGADTISGWTVNWGDGSTQNFPANATSADHTYADDAARTITVTATDEEGTYNGTKNVTVANVSPTIILTGASSVDEGSAYTLNFGATDPGADTITGWTVDWGDGSDPENLAGAATSANHTYADDGSYIITVTATDEDGSFNSTTGVTVDDVVPTVNLTGDNAAAEGTPYTLNFSATDPGADTTSGWTIDWGDGTVDNLPANTTSAMHTFADNGNFMISVNVTNEDDSGSASKAVAVANIAPVITLTGDNNVDESAPLHP